jgi:hypothetical protein
MDATLHDALREDQGLTHVAFSRLLEWLDDGVESHGETYLEMRRLCQFVRARPLS